MAGMQFEKGANDQLWGYKPDLIVEDVPSLQTATGVAQVSEVLKHNATQGYFGRLNYNFRDKYMIEANIRYDGTYVFREGNRWGLFPSASLGWNLHRESFWTVIEPYVNTLKIKASWGQLGNQNRDPYSDLELIPIQTGKLGWIFSPGGSRRIGYTSAPGIVNRNLTWETATTKNLGFETSFLKNRLSANIDIYERLTTNMVGPSEAKPGVLGASMPNINNATLRTRGWEVSLSWKHSISKDLSYFVNFNLTDYKSVVTKYNNPTGTLSTWYEGREVGEIWGYTVNDLFRTQADLDAYQATTDLKFLGANWRTGDVKYEDVNGDGKVNNGTNTVDDHGDLSIIGNDNPHYITGITLGVNYRGFDFSTLWTGILKRDTWFGSGGNLYWGFHSQWWNGNLQTRNLDYFRDEPGTDYYGVYEGEANINTDAYWPRPYLDGNQNKNTNNANTRYLMNSSYLRMSNIQLGYTLPQKLMSKLHLSNVRVFFSGENLLTFSKLPVGIDPEIQNGASMSYGADRVCSFGITISY
jgi:TonB-linked SusC/RagA family outer membrane protein